MGAWHFKALQSLQPYLRGSTRGHRLAFACGQVHCERAVPLPSPETKLCRTARPRTVPYRASVQVVRVEGSRLYVRDPSPAPSPPMCVTTCWLAATWPLLPLPALPPGVAIDVQTKELEVGCVHTHCRA